MPKKQTNKNNKQKKKIEEVTTALSKCDISKQEPQKPTGLTILSEEIDLNLLSKWPKLKTKVPPIFIHRLQHFEQHVKKILNLGIRFYQPHRGKNYIRVVCDTFLDHKHFIQYLDKKELPYHTFSHPSKRKMKVIIKGLPSNIDVKFIKEELKQFSIPVIRVHKMKTKNINERNMLVLVVLPYDNDGKAILKLTQLFGYKVTLEPAKTKPKQCHRCQKWGHSQRYCHGIIKCVKCGEEHWSKKCNKSADEEPKCANCGDAHVASYRKCIFAPEFEQYEMKQNRKINIFCYKPREIVTIDNYEDLYRNVRYTK